MIIVVVKLPGMGEGEVGLNAEGGDKAAVRKALVEAIDLMDGKKPEGMQVAEQEVPVTPMTAPPAAPQPPRRPPLYLPDRARNLRPNLQPMPLRTDGKPN
jgi:hypothetical protein